MFGPALPSGCQSHPGKRRLRPFHKKLVSLLQGYPPRHHFLQQQKLCVGERAIYRKGTTARPHVPFATPWDKRPDGRVYTPVRRRWGTTSGLGMGPSEAQANGIRPRASQNFGHENRLLSGLSECGCIRAPVHCSWQCLRRAGNARALMRTAKTPALAEFVG